MHVHTGRAQTACSGGRLLPPQTLRPPGAGPAYPTESAAHEWIPNQIAPPAVGTADPTYSTSQPHRSRATICCSGVRLLTSGNLSRHS